MTATPAALPANSPDSGPGLDLQTRILRAEQRLIQREQRVQQRLHGLTQRAEAGLRPWRLARPLLLGVLATIGMWWLLRGRLNGRLTGRARAAQSRRAEQTQHGDDHAPGMGPNLQWNSLLGLAWPLLPDRWRHRVSPTSVSSLLSLGLPLAQQLLARRASRPPPATVACVDLQRFAGTWFEVTSFSPPSTDTGSAQTKSRFLLQPDGSIALTRRQTTSGGTPHDTPGTAHPRTGSGGAKWRLSYWPQGFRWLPLAWTEQWVLHLDENYTEALVGSPDRRALCLLSRSPSLAPERVQALVQIAQDRGYAADRLYFHAR